MPESPDLDQLQRLLDGSLEPAEAATVEARLEADPAWQSALDDLSGLPHLTSEYLQPTRATPRPDRSEDVLELIDRLKLEPLPPPSEGHWRDLLAPPPDPNPSQLLGLLGSYEILELITAGGMGVVFKARDPSLDRLVAIKALAPRLASNQSARDRFLREARAVATLEHDNILPIYSVHEGHEAGSVPWFAMRYVSGGTLENLLEESGGPLPFDQLCTVARQIASALQAAHDRGIIHRDIKPGNVLVNDERDQVWVTDFGLARAIDDPTLTYPGIVAGTPQFMAPEQAEGGEVDQRTDLFSLGALLYFCATGSLPFAGATSAAVMRQVAHAVPELPSRLNPKLPAWFERLLQCLLAKNPAHRLQCAREVVEAIDKRRAPRPKRRRKPVLVALVVLLTAAGAVTLLVQWPWVAHRLNRQLADDAHPFFNTRRLGVHGSLPEAINQARPGDTIEVQSNQTLTMSSPVQIPEHTPLVIRAAAGFSPRLDVTPCSGPAFVTQSDLTLDGLSITRARSGPSPILTVVGATLTINHCRIISEGDSRKPFGSEVISVATGSSLHLANTALLASWTFSIMLGESDSSEAPISVTVDNCVLSGYSIFGMRGSSKTEIDLDLNRLACTAPVMFLTQPDRPLPRIHAEVQRCVFNSDASLWWIPRHSLQDFEQQIHWKGQHNLYQNNLGFVRNTRLPDRRAGAALVPTLAAWQTLPSVTCNQAVQTTLWSSREVDRQLPANRAEITAALLEPVSAPYLAPFPQCGPHLKNIGPSSRPLPPD